MNTPPQPSRPIGPAPPADLLAKNGYHPDEIAALPTPPPLSAPPPAPTVMGRVPWGRVFGLPLTLALLCGLTAFLLTSFVLTKWYRTQVTLYFPSTGGQGAGSIISQLTGNSGNDPAVTFGEGLYQTPLVGTSPGMAISVMATGRVQQRVMQDLHLARHWHLDNDKAGARLSKSVTYGVDRNGYLAVQAQDTNPRFAVTLVNSYVEAMRQVSTDLSTFYAHRNRTALDKHLADLRQQLLMEQNQLVALQSRSARSTPLGAASQTAFAQLESQRAQTEIDLKAANAALAARLHAAQATSDNALNLPAQVPYAQAANQKLRDLESQFAAIKADYGSDYPKYQTLQAQVQQARSDYESEVKREALAVQKGITPDVAGLIATQRTLQARLDGIHQAAGPLRATLQSLPLDQMRQARLQDEIELNEQLVHKAALDVELAHQVEQKTVPTFEVVDAAGVPKDPALPRVWFTTAFAMVAGFLLGLAWKIGSTVNRNPIIVDEINRMAQKYGLLDAPAPQETLPPPALRAPQFADDAGSAAPPALETHTVHASEARPSSEAPPH